MNEGIRVAHLSLASGTRAKKKVYFDLESNGLFNHTDCNYAWMQLFKLTARHETHVH